jgi:hypothetical protein
MGLKTFYKSGDVMSSFVQAAGGYLVYDSATQKYSSFRIILKVSSLFLYLVGIKSIRDDILISIHVQIKTRKNQISEFLAIAAMTLLLIHIVDGSMKRFSKHGFLPMSIDKKPFRISNFGISSIILFFLAFAIDMRGKNKSKVTTFLIIVGGALIGITALGVSVMDKTVATLLTVIVTGYVIMGLGVMSAIQQRKHTSKIL